MNNLYIKQFLKFALVGASNTLIYLLAYYGLLYLSVGYLIANVVGFIVSVFNAWIWSRRYVFGGSNESMVSEGIKLYFSYGVTTMLSTVLIWFMVEKLDFSKYVVPLVCLCVTVPSNFVLNKFWVFRRGGR